MTSTAPLRAIENDALIESSFRRLLAAVEGERNKIRSAAQQIDLEREGTVAELQRLRQETEDWCFREKQKIDVEWKRINNISKRMSVLWPEVPEILEINCSDHMFMIDRSTLCSIEGSYLAKMFSDGFIDKIPRDSEGRFYLELNPHCFALLVEYLQNRRFKADCPRPLVPVEQRRNMELLAEALKLKPFLNENFITTVHGTSLQVSSNNTVRATHPGWQIISAAHPLALAGASYFEVHVLENPDTRGGLAVGICGHMPQGSEVHSLRLNGCIMYNSNNGAMGDAVGEDSAAKGQQFSPGTVLGVMCDVTEYLVTWYINGNNIGTTTMKSDFIETLNVVYPVFGLYMPDQRIRVDFDLPPPQGPRDDASAPAIADELRLALEG